MGDAGSPGSRPRPHPKSKPNAAAGRASPTLQYQAIREREKKQKKKKQAMQEKELREVQNDDVNRLRRRLKELSEEKRKKKAACQAYKPTQPAYQPDGYVPVSPVSEELAIASAAPAPTGSKRKFQEVPWVTREHLGINRDCRHKVGIPGKLYHPSDRVTPIVDTMATFARQRPTTLFDVVDPNLVQKRLDGDEAQMGPMTITVAQNPNVLCQECGTNDPHDFEKTKDGDRMQCMNCGCVAGQLFDQSLHRDKNCSEDEDKTTRADRPQEEKGDRFDRRAMTADEARRSREREVRGVYVSKKTREKQGVGWAPEVVARMTARAQRNRQEMAPRDQTKELQILGKLDDLFVALEPMDPEVKRYCRIQTYCMWQNAVRHLKVCEEGGRACQLNIRSKGHPVIAESALLCALQNLVHGTHTIEGVTHAHIMALNDRLNARVNAAGVSAAQRAVRTQVVRLMAHDASSPHPIPCCVQCTPQSATSSPVHSERSACSGRGKANSVSPERQQLRALGLHDDSDASCGSSDDPAQQSYILRLRDSISRLRQVLSSTRAPVVHATMAVVANNRCIRSLCDATEYDERLRGLSMQAFAFVILETVARRAEDMSKTTSGSASRMRPRLLQSIGMSADRVEKAVAAANAALPLDAVPHPSANKEEDGLF